jgi:hypothetical protein
VANLPKSKRWERGMLWYRLFFCHLQNMPGSGFLFNLPLRIDHSE